MSLARSSSQPKRPSPCGAGKLMCKQFFFRLRRQGLTLLAAVLAYAGSSLAGAARSFAFDFENHPKEENFSLFDFTIVDPMAEVDLSIAHNAGHKVIAYISVSEVGDDAWYRAEALATVPVKWVNPNWGSAAMDISDPRWAQFVVQRLAKNAVDRGYDGFFLDTVDDYWDLGDQDPAHQDSYYIGMANLIKAIKAAYPDKELISNRGFEIYDLIKNSIDGIAIESLFRTYDEAGHYIPTPQADTDDLLALIAPIIGKKPIYVIDYVDPADLTLARQTAQRCLALGLNPLIGPLAHDGTVLAPDPRDSQSLPVPPVAPPVIVKQPQGGSKPVGGSITFKVVATGANLTYQWQWKGADIAGATAPKLVLTGLKASWAGAYRVRVANSGGSKLSSQAVLTVTKKGSK